MKLNRATERKRGTKGQREREKDNVQCHYFPSLSLFLVSRLPLPQPFAGFAFTEVTVGNDRFFEELKSLLLLLLLLLLL